MRELSQKVLAEARLRLYFETIEVNHFDYLLEACGIGEAYDALPLNLRQVQSSLLRARLNIEPDDDKDDIANKLTIEFLSAGVKFFYMSDAELEDKGIPRHEQEGIFSSEFNPSTYSIEINITDRFIENLLLSGGPKLLAPTVLTDIKHEDTHKQQYKKSNGKVKGLNTSIPVKNINLTDKERAKEHLSLPSEIDAHARELARSLYEANWSGDAIIKGLKTKPSPLLRFPIFQQYWYFFGQQVVKRPINKSNEKDKLDKTELSIIRDIRIWNRFLSKTVAYLRTTNKYKIMPDFHFFKHS